MFHPGLFHVHLRLLPELNQFESIYSEVQPQSLSPEMLFQDLCLSCPVGKWPGGLPRMLTAQPLAGSGRAPCCSWLSAQPEGLSQHGVSSCRAWAPGAPRHPSLVPGCCSLLSQPKPWIKHQDPWFPGLVTEVLYDLG